MNSLNAFFNMGGYGVFVWSAYGICAAVMVWNLLYARQQAKLTEHRIKRSLQHQDTKQ
jgi:heme exporter protein CcmD